MTKTKEQICVKCGLAFQLSVISIAARKKHKRDMLCDDCYILARNEKSRIARHKKEEQDRLLAKFKRGDYGLSFVEHYEKKTGKKLNIKQ